MIDFPARKVRAADLPLLALTVRGQDERAFLRTCQNSYFTHHFLLSVYAGFCAKLIGIGVNGCLHHIVVQRSPKSTMGSPGQKKSQAPKLGAQALLRLLECSSERFAKVLAFVN